MCWRASRQRSFTPVLSTCAVIHLRGHALLDPPIEHASPPPLSTSRTFAQDLGVAYAGRAVLSDLSLRVSAGTIYTLVGGNGRGKFTTLSVLMRLLKPASGQVNVAGFVPREAPANARSQLAYLPENVAQYEHLSAVENANYLTSLSGAAWHQRLGCFSKGMRQKVPSPLGWPAAFHCFCWMNSPPAWPWARVPTFTSCLSQCAHRATYPGPISEGALWLQCACTAECAASIADCPVRDLCLWARASPSALAPSPQVL